MYGIFTNIYPINGPNVGKYTSTMEHMGDISNKNQYYIIISKFMGS